MIAQILKKTEFYICRNMLLNMKVGGDTVQTEVPWVL